MIKYAIIILLKISIIIYNKIQDMFYVIIQSEIMSEKNLFLIHFCVWAQRQCYY